MLRLRLLQWRWQANILRSPQCRWTSLSVGSAVGEPGADALADALRRNGTLTSLGLGRNVLGMAAGRFLANVPVAGGTMQCLRELNLSGNGIGDVALAQLAESLAGHQALACLICVRGTVVRQTRSGRDWRLPCARCAVCDARLAAVPFERRPFQLSRLEEPFLRRAAFQTTSFVAISTS